MPTNLYGPHDNFQPENSHVVLALLRRFHEAKLAGANNVVAWGTGSPMREFLHMDNVTYQQHTQSTRCLSVVFTASR